AGLNPAGGEIRELRLDEVEAGGHEVVERTFSKSQWRPVEVVMRDEALVLLPAAALEEHLEHRGMSGPGEPLQLTERRQRHTHFTTCGARKREPSGQRVVHGCLSN